MPALVLENGKKSPLKGNHNLPGVQMTKLVIRLLGRSVNVWVGENYGNVPRFWGRKNKANFHFAPAGSRGRIEFSDGFGIVLGSEMSFSPG